MCLVLRTIYTIYFVKFCPVTNFHDKKVNLNFIHAKKVFFNVIFYGRKVGRTNKNFYMLYAYVSHLSKHHSGGLESVRIGKCQKPIFVHFGRNWKESELERDRSGKCQKQKMSEVESVRSGMCQNWKVSELESVRFGKCQNFHIL